MKKFLTVLLVIAVMFTFSFSSAFADISTDEVTALKTYATTLAQGYYGDNGVIAKAAQSYLDKITYDEDGYVFNMNEIKGYVKADTIKAYMADVVDKAEKTFSSKVATIIDGITTTGAITTNAEVQDAVETAYNETMAAMIDSLIIGGGDNHLKPTVVQDLVAEQFKAEKAAADAVLASINPEDYSDSLDEYKIVAANIDELATTTQLGLTNGKTYTAKGYVKAILDKQNADILAAETTVKTNAIDAVVAVRNAAKYAKESILGHKIVTGENYYIEAVPTIADLKADTSVETAKANAIAQIKAALASKQVAMGQAIQEGIDALDKYGKLTDSQKELLDTLNEQKTDLAENFAAVEAVYVAKIGYRTTTDAVKSYLSAALDEIKAFANETDAAKKGMVTKATQGIFDDRVKMEKTVKTLKDDAALLALQKDVNGKPYYDAAVLAKNLEKAIEAAYGGTSYADCYKMLAGGSEAALINAKIEYIKFIKGDATTNLVPKDSKGYKVTKVWNKAGAAGTETAVAIKKLAAYVDSRKVTYEDADKVLYDKAQKAELKALVDETKAAIEGAKTIAEIEKIFAEANDKYNDIPTTKDHQDAWNTGKIGAAYDKADYEKELTAYATYFIAKRDSKVYDAATYADVSDVLIKVAYPVVYTAYTADELAAKVAEAKAAIDAIKTKEQVKAEKAAVEAAIKALPAASAITVADKDAITAAADLLDAFLDIPGTAKTDVTNNAVLDAALKAYEAADAKQIKDAYDALKNKDITTADAEAIEALRTLLDAHADFVKDYKVVDTLIATAYETKVVDLENKLSDAKVAEVKAMMIKLPTNPTAAQRAEVEAARAAYEALTLAEKAKIVGELPYQNLIDAEEALGINNDEAAKAYVQDLSIKARSTKTSKGVKVTIKADVQELLDSGYTVEYKFYRSTKSNAKFGSPKITKTTNTYLNTSGKKGTRYYYKARLVVKNAKGEVVAITPLSQCLYATRVF